MAVPVPLLLAGCDGPLSTLAPAGPSADAVALLWWLLLGGALALMLLVGGLLAAGFGPPRKVRETRWTLGLGLWFPLIVLSLTLAAALALGQRTLSRPDGALRVGAEAAQWRWRFTSPGPEGPVVSEDVLHIPAGRPVDVVVTSRDVIHSLWVPRLAGKIDAIPGRETRLRIEATVPGVYDGLCAEFCGLDHALMRFIVVAHAAENWPPPPGWTLPDDGETGR